MCICPSHSSLPEYIACMHVRFYVSPMHAWRVHVFTQDVCMFMYACTLYTCVSHGPNMYRTWGESRFEPSCSLRCWSKYLITVTVTVTVTVTLTVTVTVTMSVTVTLTVTVTVTVSFYTLTMQTRKVQTFSTYQLLLYSLAVRRFGGV
jgi:hypothetical protein